MNKEKCLSLPRDDATPQGLLKHTKLMMLNCLDNPTSATGAFFDETVDVAEKNNICVVHDFVYGALGFDGERPVISRVIVTQTAQPGWLLEGFLLKGFRLIIMEYGL